MKLKGRLEEAARLRPCRDEVDRHEAGNLWVLTFRRVTLTTPTRGRERIVLYLVGERVSEETKKRERGRRGGRKWKRSAAPAARRRRQHEPISIRGDGHAIRSLCPISSIGRIGKVSDTNRGGSRDKKSHDQRFSWPADSAAIFLGSLSSGREHVRKLPGLPRPPRPSAKQRALGGNLRESQKWLCRNYFSLIFRDGSLP